MYNISVVYKDKNDVEIFDSVINWTFITEFLLLYCASDTRIYISKSSIKRMTVHEVEQKE